MELAAPAINDEFMTRTTAVSCHCCLLDGIEPETRERAVKDLLLLCFSTAVGRVFNSMVDAAEISGYL